MNITKLSNWFIPTDLTEDYEEYRRARYLVLTYFMLAVLLVIYLIIYHLTKQKLQFFLYLGAEIVIISTLFLLRKTGAVTFLTNIGVVAFSILLWTQVFVRGGIFSPHLPWIGFIPILAFLFTGRVYGLIWSFITLTLTVMVYILEINGTLVLKPDAFALDATYFFKSILPFFVFLFIIILTYEKSKLKDIQNLTKAKDEISVKNNILEKQKQEITDSILYAKRIQTALLPLNDLISDIFPEHCILYKPRDIVSGDFYWIKQIQNKVVIAVADCTGHGVPGAFMSLLGIMLLNESVSSIDDLSASSILNKLRDKVKDALRQTGKRNEQKDGMDMALCILDKESQVIQYAGAYNPLYLIRNNEIIETKADKNPIGIYVMEKPSFTDHNIKIENGDIIYLFSDGYVDQMGENNKKFLRKNFKDLLLNIHHKPMYEQKEILDSTIENWKKDEKQVDDILVFGFKI